MYAGNNYRCWWIVDMRMSASAQTSRQTALLTYLVVIVVVGESERATNECIYMYAVKNVWKEWKHNKDE
jgi:glucan phosphoethanolaminetransferase (alkaline phosphatase superfamily)